MKNPLLCLALLLPVACNATDMADPVTKAKIEALDTQLAQIEVGIEDAESKWTGALAEIGALSSQVDTMSTEDIRAALTLAMSTADQAKSNFDAKVTAWDAAIGQQNELVDGVAKGLTLPLIPFLPPGLPQLAPLLLSFVFDRPRKHAGKAIQHALKGSLGEAVKSLAKVPGLLYSDEAEQPTYQGPGDIVKPG